MPSLPVVTRFAPSPSGALHLGNARTALFNLLLARHHGGRFVLRIEDTDSSRSPAGLVLQLQQDLRWLGLDWDEGPERGGPHAPYAQSARGELYRAAFERLQRSGKLYPCFCTPLELDLSRRAQLAAGQPPRYAGTCRELTDHERAARLKRGAAASLRFRVPTGETLEFADLVHGAQSFRTDDIGDFIVRRADGTAAFFFSNALDDAVMQITHVLRGEDHLSNTPRQLLLLRALDAAAPQYGHLALLVGQDGTPLSKRLGAVSLRDLREQGYLPAALCNHLFRLGHSCGDNGFLELDRAAELFDVEHLGRAPARFDFAQLQHWQKEAVQRLDAAGTAAWLDALAIRFGAASSPSFGEFVDAVRANLLLPGDADHWAEVVLGDPELADDAGRACIAAAGPAFFAAAQTAVDACGNDWQALTKAVRERTGAKGPGLYKPLRYALTGVGEGPELGPLLRLIPPAAIRRRLHRYASPA